MKKILFLSAICICALWTLIFGQQAHAAQVPYWLSVGFINANGVYMYPLLWNSVFSLNAVSFLTWMSHVGTNAEKDQLIGDVNGDGWTDIVFLDEASPGYIYTRLNNKNGSFSSEYITSPVARGNYGFWWYDNEKDHLGDVNGDGRADVVFMFRDNGTNNAIYTYLSSGNWYFSSTPIISLSWAISDAGGATWANNESQLQGDFNGDGLMDIMHSLESTNQVEVYLSKGNGTFSWATITTSMSEWDVGQTAGETTVVGDVNGDGYDDIIHFYTTFSKVRFGLGNGKFQTAAMTDTHSYKGWLDLTSHSFAADTNGDNFDDLIRVSENDGGFSKIVVVPGNGNGTFSTAIVSTWAAYPGANFGMWTAEQTFIGYFLGNPALSVNLSVSTWTIAENWGVARIYATLSGGTSMTWVSLAVAFSSSAIRWTDYAASTGRIYIAPWATSWFVLLTGINDSIVEWNETVHLVYSHTDNAFSWNVSTQIITIIDDDDALLDISASHTWASETHQGNIMVYATIVGGVTSTGDIVFSLIPWGAATQWQDYSISSGTIITIAAWATTWSTMIQFIDDSTYEGNESILLHAGVTTWATSESWALVIDIRDDEALLWGWGWYIKVAKDICPNGDTSPTEYDRLCSGLSLQSGGTPSWTGSTTTWNNTSSTGVTNNETPWENNPTTPENPITWSEDTDCATTEDNDAYVFAKKHGITTMPTCKKANLDGLLLRKHAAKMIVNFAKNILKKQPDTTRNCVFSDMAAEDGEMNQYALEACQMWIMGVDGVGVPAQTFSPNGVLDKAQLATMISRLLYGSANNDTACRYCKHVEALRTEGIITVTSDLTIPLRRGWAMLMLMRVNQ